MKKRIRYEKAEAEVVMFTGSGFWLFPSSGENCPSYGKDETHTCYSVSKSEYYCYSLSPADRYNLYDCLSVIPATEIRFVCAEIKFYAIVQAGS